MTTLAKIQHDWLHDDRERDDERTFLIHSISTLKGYPAFGLCWYKGELCTFTMDFETFSDFVYENRKTFIYIIERVNLTAKIDLLLWMIEDHVKNFLYRRRLRF